MNSTKHRLICLILGGIALASCDKPKKEVKVEKYKIKSFQLLGDGTSDCRMDSSGNYSCGRNFIAPNVISCEETFSVGEEFTDPSRDVPDGADCVVTDVRDYGGNSLGLANVDSAAAADENCTSADNPDCAPTVTSPCPGGGMECQTPAYTELPAPDYTEAPAPDYTEMPAPEIPGAAESLNCQVEYICTLPATESPSPAAIPPAGSEASPNNPEYRPVRPNQPSSPVPSVTEPTAPSPSQSPASEPEEECNIDHKPPLTRNHGVRNGDLREYSQGKFSYPGCVTGTVSVREEKTENGSTMFVRCERSKCPPGLGGANTSACLGGSGLDTPNYLGD